MRTILITGINGYLGSSLAKDLSISYNIIGLEYSLSNLHRLAGTNFKVYSTENGFPGKLFKDQQIDIIIHTATSYGRQDEEVKTIANTNLFMPFELLDEAIKNRCTWFINTDTILDRFVSPYSLTKRHFQEWLYLRRKEMKVINMQLEHFYGPGAPDTNFVTTMIQRLKQNDPIINLTEGKQERDFVFIEDVLSAYKTILDKIDELPGLYNEYQVSTARPITIKQLLMILKEMTGSASQLNFGALPYRENEPMRSETDPSALVKLGWKPKNNIEQGLQKCL